MPTSNYPLTTGQVRTICRVSREKVIDWCDSGLLDHYLVPGTNHRRVLAKILRKFMVEHSLPIEWLNTYELDSSGRGGWI